MKDKIINLLNFRNYTETDNFQDKPNITAGSIILGILIRLLLVLLTSIFVIYQYPQIRDNMWILLFFIWLLVAYPAYKQYTNFYKRIDKLQESTLCGSCQNFDKNSQLCRLYDTHVSLNHIPCGGDSWEPS